MNKPDDIAAKIRAATVPAPDDLRARCTATIPTAHTARRSLGRPLALAGIAAAVVTATLFFPTRPAQPPTGMPAAFADTEAAMRQVNAWHVKERFVHLDWLREKPRPLHLSGHYPQLTETWYRADAGELSHHTSRPGEPVTKNLLKPNGEFWTRWVNYTPVYRDPHLKKMHEDMDARLWRETGGKFGKRRLLPPARYLRTAINARGEFLQWDTLHRQNWGAGTWNARRQYIEAKITHPEQWGHHAAGQVLVQNLSDAQSRKLKVKNRLLLSGKSVWKGLTANRFEFQVVPTEPKEALPPSLPDIFLVVYVDPTSHRVVATQEFFRDQGQTKRLMFRQQEFDYTQAEPERFSVEAFTRGAVPLPDKKQ